MKPLVVIPARGGSKGIPRKNIKPLQGKPLIHYTIEAARRCFDDAVICISTDDLEIKEVSERLGIKVPFLRDKNLASDQAGTYEVLLDAVTFYEKQGYFPDTLILLQPTSPFRTASHIEGALAQFSPTIDMVVSVKETRSNPYYTLFEEDTQGYLKKSKESTAIRRQDCPKVWEYNGAIYIINIDSLKRGNLNTFDKVVKYEMDEKSSHDLDTLLDWQLAEILAKQ